MAITVLIAIDDSSEAEKAFEWYLDNIHQPGNDLVILHTVDLSALNDAGDESSSAASQAWSHEKTKIQALEDKYRWKLNEHGLSGKIRTESGKPGDVIVKEANDEKAGLIVIGSRGLSKLKRTLSGSVSDHVLHNANCPVVICKIPD